MLNKAVRANNLDDFWSQMMSPEAKLKNVYEANMRIYLLACKRHASQVSQSDLQDIVGNQFIHIMSHFSISLFFVQNQFYKTLLLIFRDIYSIVEVPELLLNGRFAFKSRNLLKEKLQKITISSKNCKNVTLNFL